MKLINVIGFSILIKRIMVAVFIGFWFLFSSLVDSLFKLTRIKNEN